MTFVNLAGFFQKVPWFTSESNHYHRGDFFSGEEAQL